MLSFPSIDPVAITIWKFQVRWYGLMYVFGFLTGWLLGRYRASKPQWNWTTQEVDDLITYCVIGLILGARLGYVLFYDFPMFISNPLEIVKIWKGGMSFHGGALGLIVCFYLFARRYRKPMLEVADFLIPLAPPGLFFGRIGNFINAELWGRTTDVPWAVVFPDPASGFQPRHPSQLYEAFLEGIVLFVILWFFSAKPRPRGAVSGLFSLGYGVFRFAVEFFRQPDTHLGFIAFGWLTMGQLLSSFMIVFGIGLLWYAYRNRNEKITPDSVY